MTIYKDIYPETILNIINNENFDNIELDSPMIKPEVIAKALDISFDEKLTVEFDSASRRVKPNLYDDFLTNRRKNMWRIANVIVSTDLPPSRLIVELQERTSIRLTDELLMPEKLLKRLIKEQMTPQYVKIRHTNPKTGGQIVIEPKHPNVLRGFFQPNNVINITSETEEAYSFIDHSHVYQIPKTIVEQK